MGYPNFRKPPLSNKRTDVMSYVPIPPPPRPGTVHIPTSSVPWRSFLGPAVWVAFVIAILWKMF